MPELPEVETVKNTLKKQILNKKIKSVQVIYEPIVINKKDDFITKLTNESFLDIKRKGKWLIFETKNYYLLSHLRMEGKFFIKDHFEKIEKHEHIIITFNDLTDLRYCDTRKFGRMQLINKEDLKDTSVGSLGLEPNDSNLTSTYLLNKLKNKKIPIKTALLDQTIISGLGNIYANEVLFYARINPLKKANELDEAECQKIIEGANKIIKEAIKLGGTTIRSYTSSLGVTGKFQNNLKVHKRENEPCPICQTKIKNIKVNGRSTYYCPKCQK